MPNAIFSLLFPALLLQTGPAAPRSVWFNQDPVRPAPGKSGPGSIPAAPAPPMALTPVLKRLDPLADEPEATLYPAPEAASGGRAPVRPGP